MKTLFRLLLKDTLSDKISLFYSILFPIGLMIAVKIFINPASYSALLSTIISISLLFWNLQGLPFQILRQKSKGVYRLIKITPMNMTTFISTMMVVRTLISMIINLFIMIIGFLMLNIPFSIVQIILWLFIIVAASLCFSAVGFFISNLAKNEGQINAYCNLLYLPMIFCTEAFYSLQNTYEFINVIGKCLPFHYIVDSFRQAAAGHLDSVIVSILIIFLFTSIFFFLSLLTFIGLKKRAKLNKVVTSEK